MTVIIGGRQSILAQIPKELKDKHPRLSEALDSSQCSTMLEQSLSVLQDADMKGSHMLFADIVRLIIALQLSVAEARFGNEDLTPQKPQNSGIILP